VAEATTLGVQLAAALAAVHAAGILHRDIKPANVMKDVAGRWVLADFGLGRRGDAAGATPSGTPMYMAPELLHGGGASERSDVCSLGLSLWFALAGRHPFDAASLAALEAAAARGPQPPLRESRADVPAPLAAAIERAIAPDAAARWGSARELEQALAS